MGVVVLGKPRPKLLKELGVKSKAVYTANLNSKENQGAATEEESEEEDEDEKEEFDEISWTGHVQLHTIVWPTIQGTMDIEQTGSVYAVLVTLTLPDGKAELKDKFEFNVSFSTLVRYFNVNFIRPSLSARE